MAIQMLLLVISVAVLLTCCKGQDVGKVFVNGTAFSFAISPNPIGSFTVSIEVTEGTLVDDVTVDCEADTYGNGYTNITFTSVDLNPGTTTADMTVNLLEAGRTVAVRCWGISKNSGTQFTRATSMSEDISVTVRPVPVVSICSFEVVVQDNAESQTVPLELSEPVVGSRVTVSCVPVPTPGSISLTITSPIQIDIGGQRADLNFVLVNKAGNPVTVSCSAEGGQYIKASSTSSVMFRMESTLAVLYPQRASIYTSSFQLLLVVSGFVGSSIGCQATFFNTTAKAEEELLNPTCSTVTAPTTTPATTDPTATASPLVLSEWRIEDPEFELKTDQFYKVVEVIRNGDIGTPVWEFVVTTCCSRSISNGWVAAMLATVYLQPDISVNWDSATDSETVISNPAFVDVSPCPCNLLTGACDLNCCCDSDCNTEDRSLFSACIPGLQGGQSAPVPTYSCSSTHFNKDDWFPLMCVQWEYNALLGYYYTSQSAVRSEMNFNSYLTDVTDYTYRETDRINMEDETSPDSGYQDGEVMKTVNPTYVGTLALPQPILSSNCLMSPVRYLRNTNTQCSYEMSADLCSRHSVLSVFSYVMSSTMYRPACPDTFSVLQSPDSRTVAPTIVNYHCASNISPYIRGVSRSTPQKELPPRCLFDDGYTEPASPNYNAGVNAECDNVVLDVFYDILWSGTHVVQLNATIILGTVPMSRGGMAAVLTPSYRTKFVHDFQPQENTLQDNYLTSQAAYERSGRRGYVIGKPIYSGTAVLSQVGDFISINQSPNQQMAYWLTGVDSFCSDSRGYILFGEDSLSGCYIQLGLQNFTNCTTLREEVVAMMDSLMPADRLGKDGYNHPNVDTDWIKVLRQNVSDVLIIPSSVATGEDFENMTLLTEYLTGQCSNMISNVHLDIMYADTGRSNGEPIYEIVGAQRKYSVSNWQLMCDNGFSACSVDDYKENFHLTSTVRFIKVPAQTPTPVILFEYSPNPSVCWADVCWDNFMFPLTREYTVDSHQYSVVNSLLIIFFIISYLALAQPWW